MSYLSPVFIDHSGRRWRHIRRAALAAGVITTLLALVLAVGVLIPPLIPELHPGTASSTTRPLTSRAERQRLVMKNRLQAALARYGPALVARRRSRIPVMSVGGGKRTPHGKAIIAGFYVNWDENSYASLDTNLKHLDWVILEWAFVAKGGDSLRIDLTDKRVLQRVAKEPPEQRPKVLVMVSKFDGVNQAFGEASVRALLSRPAARARAIAQLKHLVDTVGLAGVTLDFETTPGLAEASLEFTRELRAALGPAKLTTVAVPAYVTDAHLRKLAANADMLFAMLFDEHYIGSDPGPVSSQQFYAARARAMAAVVPPRKLILMVGGYGYDWNDQNSETGKLEAEAKTFQEVVTALRDSGATLRFDPTSMNPYATYTSPDSVDHVMWFLDGVTAFNEIRVAEALRAAGSAIWRLGAEDPSIWRAIGDDGALTSAANLREVPPGYYPEIEGIGEIIRVRAQPTSGTRTVQVDSTTGLVSDEAFASFPTPFIVQRYGLQRLHPHWVALTFDDGPDGSWTGPILDTLASRGVKATFFVIGRNADAHINLLRRMYAEGHEIGNHTYSHPNLGLTSNFVTRMEIDANERLIEALLDRHTALFRPPFFGDAEPTTENDLVPVAIASDRRYLTIGLHVDSEDWQRPSPDSIVRNVLEGRSDVDSLGMCRDTTGHAHEPERRSCSIVLLHDGGGVRANTVAAVGPLIDSLRAHGDTLVLVSQLAGLTRDEAMPPLASVSEARRLVEAGGFYFLGAGEWVLFWVFTLAVALGIGRLLFVGALAFIQRVRQHQDREKPTPFAPPVSVIIPAYNEETVICRTIESLVAQEYAGAIEIVVVDDGSLDATYATAMASHGRHPQVAVVTKPNGGKASALNYGIERARHEIVVCLDADTIFSSDTVANLVQPLTDPLVAAVAGNAKVGNRINIVTRWQALEYVTSQNLDRRAFSLLDCITVVPGAVGAWRRSVVKQAGGFRGDTLAEDQDLTMAVLRAGYSVGYADGAIAYTEAPDALRGLAKQRFRWSFGTLQCAWKHRAVLFARGSGSLGWIALPNVWLFQLFLPAISPIADLMFLWSLLSVWLVKQEHGGTYALTNLTQVMTYYAVFLLVDWAAAMIAFLMEPGEDRQLTWLIFIQRFAYRQVMYWVVVRSFAAAFRGHVVGWGKLDRKATVEVRVAGARS